MNSEAWGPPTSTTGVPVRLSCALPALLIVNVLQILPPETSAEPKSVWSAGSGVLSPSTIVSEFPRTSISGTKTPVPEQDVVLSPSVLLETAVTVPV